MSGTGIKSYITPGIPTVGPEATIHDVARQLPRGRGLVTVCDGGRLVGTLTEQDLARAGETPVSGRSELKASDLMPGSWFESFQIQ